MAQSPIKEVLSVPLPHARRTPKSRWAGAVRDLALSVAVGVDEDGYREVLACQSAAAGRKAVAADLKGPLQGASPRDGTDARGGLR